MHEPKRIRGGGGHTFNFTKSASFLLFIHSFSPFSVFQLFLLPPPPPCLFVFFIPFLFPPSFSPLFVSVFRLLWISSLAYPNLLGKDWLLLLRDILKKGIMYQPKLDLMDKYIYPFTLSKLCSIIRHTCRPNSIR